MFKLFILSFLVSFQGGIYQYSLTDINNSSINLESYKGKYIVIVNVASQSRYAAQLEKLEQLYQKHKDSVVLIAIPSNDFGHEPGDNAAIKTALTAGRTISYPVASKTSVSGASIHPLYQWLTQRSANGSIDSPVENDFYKFLVNKEGQLIGVFSGFIDPLGGDLEKAITQ